MAPPVSRQCPVAEIPDMTEQEIDQLRQALKRCPPGTFEAACEFHRTHDLECLRLVILGVIERYVERGLRSKLNHATDSLRLVEDLGIDSLTMMEIVLLTEDALGISVTNEELIKLHTLGDVRQFVAAKAAAGEDREAGSN